MKKQKQNKIVCNSMILFISFETQSLHTVLGWCGTHFIDQAGWS